MSQQAPSCEIQSLRRRSPLPDGAAPGFSRGLLPAAAAAVAHPRRCHGCRRRASGGPGHVDRPAGAAPYLAQAQPVSAQLQPKTQQQLLRQQQLLPPPRETSSLLDNALFIFTTTWIPGISYIFKPIYIVLSGVHRNLYFSLGTLSQVLAALPYLLLGEIAGGGAFFWFGIALFAVFGAAWLVKRRLCMQRLSTTTEFKE